MTYPKGGSEYGGYPGLIQPEPHPVGDGKGEAEEQLHMLYRTEPADETDTVAKQVDIVRKQGAIDRGKQNG